MSNAPGTRWRGLLIDALNQRLVGVVFILGDWLFDQGLPCARS